MLEPLVSICVPTYNGATFLEEALGSIVTQTYPNIEVVVSDDASRDTTWQILERFKSNADIPVQLHHHTPSGIGANWNNSLLKANGVYIKFLFQDDVLETTCVEQMVHFMEKNPNCGLVACKRSFISQEKPTDEIQDWIKQYKDLQVQFNQDNSVLHLNDTLFEREDFLKGCKNKIGEPTATMFRKSILKKVGYFDEDLRQILDYVFYYRILKKYSIAILPEQLVRFRIHPDQATNVNRHRNISDYEDYDHILYREFLPLLSKYEQNRLKSKYDWTYLWTMKIKRKLFGKR